MDNLVSILKIPALNHDVKTKILRLIQNWATAFEGKANLSYMGEVYRALQHEGECDRYHSSADRLISSRVQFPTQRPYTYFLCNGGYSDSSRMDRLRCVPTMSHVFFVHEPETSLSKLRSSVRSAMFIQSHGTSTLRYRAGGQGLR